MPDREDVSFDSTALANLRSLLARRRREMEIDAAMESRIFATFEEDIRQGFLICHPISATLMSGAANLISILPDVPLERWTPCIWPLRRRAVRNPLRRSTP